jgi:hypothetical protein
MGIRDIFRKILPRSGSAAAKLPSEGEKLIETLKATNESLRLRNQAMAEESRAMVEASRSLAETSRSVADATLAVNQMSDRLKERIAAIKDAAKRRQAGGADPVRGR